MSEVTTRLDRIAAEPKYEEVDCTECDATGIVIKERRERPRDPSSDICREFVELRNELTLRGALLDEQSNTIKRLLAENRRQREVIHRAANAIIQRMRGPSPAPTAAGGHPTQTAATGDGVHQPETAQ